MFCLSNTGLYPSRSVMTGSWNGIWKPWTTLCCVYMSMPTHNTPHYHNWSLLFLSVAVYAHDTGGQCIAWPHLIVFFFLIFERFNYDWVGPSLWTNNPKCINKQFIRNLPSNICTTQHVAFLICIKQLAIPSSLWSSETLKQEIYLFTSSHHVHLTDVSPIMLCLFYNENSNDAEMEARLWKSLRSPIAKEKTTKQENIVTPFQSFNLLNCYFSSAPLHAHIYKHIYTLSNLHMGIIHSSCSFRIPCDCQVGPINISSPLAHYKHLPEAGYWLRWEKLRVE